MMLRQRNLFLMSFGQSCLPLRNSARPYDGDDRFHGHDISGL